MLFIQLLLISYGAGVFGAMLGLGGGVFLVPLLTLVAGLPMHTAIATSLISVVATSTATASIYIRQGFTNLRLAMLLEVATTIGAVAGSLVAVFLSSGTLSMLFAVMAVYTAVTMWTSRNRKEAPAVAVEREHPLNLEGSYLDPRSGAQVRYQPQRLSAGLAFSVVAGGVSGLLGIGGGVVKVPIMNLVMRIPMKAAAATSNFMVGVTATASAFVYYSKGFVDPVVSVITVFGVFLGARTGAVLSTRLETRQLKTVFILILIGIAIQMFLKGLGIGGGL